MDTTSLLSCTGCHFDAMGTIGLFFGLAFIGDEKIGRDTLSGFPLSAAPQTPTGSVLARPHP